jgi:hypothetical protein
METLNMSIPPLTRSVGTAERAMRALLEREPARENLSFAQWTALVFTNAAPLSVAQIAQRQLAGHVVASESEARQAVDDLLGLGILANGGDGALQHTEKGRRVFASLSQSIEELTRSLYGDLPPTDIEATHRTLVEVANRANKLLAAK